VTIRPLWRLPAALVAVLLGACSATSDGGPPATGSTAPPPSLAEPSSPATPSPSAPADCVAGTVQRMSVAQRAGQVLMIGTPVDEPGGIARAVRDRHLGGVFLAGRSTRPAASLRADIARLEGDEVPLLVALDQEGGSVQTLKGRDFPLIPSARRLGAGPAAKLRTEVRDSARRLAGIGVTVNLAPVADTVPASLGEDNPPIGAFHREYGSDPRAVADDIAQVVPASQGAGVLTVLKHFPGLGRVRANTDTSTDAVDRTATVDDPYLAPFAAGIKAGSAAVMISSARYPKLDATNIAAFSKPVITGLLRHRMGYTGLVMSDDLGAADAAESVRVGDRAVRFIAAGGDLVLSIRPQDAGPMSAALIAAAGRDPAFDARLTDAARQVISAKRRAGLLCG
jgi:beta-N-acetylhexosaminidase